MRKAAWALRIILPLLLVSCMHERPSDLRLVQVYVADLSATSGYKVLVARGLPPSPLRLAIELSTSETFPLGVRLAWGFCGERKMPDFLLRAADSNA